MSRVLASILIVSALASALAAQEDPRIIRDGMWNQSLAAAQSAARYTGRPLLVFFYEDWCGFCEQVQQVMGHPDLAEAGRRFILVKTTIEENEDFARKHKIEMHHQIVMLDWSGGVLGKVTEFTTAKDVASAIIEGATANDMNAGRKLLELTYYGKAAERFRMVAKITRDEKRRAEAAKALEEIADRAKRQLEIIKGMIRNGRSEEALDALNEFVKDFTEKGSVEKGDPFFLAEAEKLRAQLKSGKPVALPDDRPVVVVPGPETKPTPEEQAKRLFDKGMVYEWDKNFLDAVATYRKVARDFPGTAAAAEAEKRSKLFLDDPATRAALAKQQMDVYCRRMLEMGELYERNNRDDEAIVRYRSILGAYPDSDYADEAQKRLNEIERRHAR